MNPLKDKAKCLAVAKELKFAALVRWLELDGEPTQQALWFQSHTKAIEDGLGQLSMLGLYERPIALRAVRDVQRDRMLGGAEQAPGDASEEA